jgi:two-component system chemotaxis response regulator CheB
MIQHPCPVVIMSNVVRGGEASVMEFLTLGAVDFISKPVRNEWIALQHQQIRERVRAAARARVSAFSRPRMTAPKTSGLPMAADNGPCRSLVILNAGPGGFVELVHLIGGLSPGVDAAVIGLQTIPPAFCSALIDYIKPRASMPVAQIRDRIALRTGRCHLGINGVPVELDTVDSVNWRLRTEGSAGGAHGREYNQFDRFLSSVATAFDGSVTVVLLSGADVVSLKGLKMVRDCGANILVQQLDKAVAPDPLEPVVAEGIATAEAGTDALIAQIAEMTSSPAK